MNLIYIIFIIIIFFSLITGLIVTILEKREKKKYNELVEDESSEEEEVLELDNSTSDNNELIQSPINEVNDDNAFSINNPVPDISAVQNISYNNEVVEKPVVQVSSINNVVPVIQNSEEVYQAPIVENVVSNPIESTLKVDSIEKLENTIELKINNSNNQFYDVPQLSPYSVVDDDVI